MKKVIVAAIMVLALGSGTGCTNMSATSQGATSGAVFGAAAGVGIAALSGGALGWGALAGAGAGALAGGIVGHEQEKRRW